MKVWFSPYTLVPRSRLGSKTNAKKRHGALLRLDINSSASGFADLFPWPELGDETLEQQLIGIKSGTPSRLARRSLAMAEQDAIARSGATSLFNGHQVPPSHHLITNLLDNDLLVEAIRSQSTRIKAKLGADLERELVTLDNLIRHTSPNIKIRLDFNESISPYELRSIANRQLIHYADRIDFIEDPCVYDPDTWQWLNHSVGIPIALDRQADQHKHLRGFSVLVIKPAIQTPHTLVETSIQQGLRIVFTSYLDHPVGQLHAAWQAAGARAEFGEAVDIAGLLSQVAYDSNPWSEAVFSPTGQLTSTSAPGIGFVELLEKEPWRRLC
jgi:O-succinylbenzoate synthase